MLLTATGFFAHTIWLINLICICVYAQALEGTVSLSQGVVLGLKIFPESSRMAVYSYLGIPYAQAPIGNLRFAPPKKHIGWGNRTMMARDYKPICPQLQNYVFHESHNGYSRRNTLNDEDCLFLNIWSPQSAVQYGNYSVLAIVTGEEQSFDWAQNRPTGLDLAAEGIVVVSIQSRMNVFGWLSLHNVDAPGNLGLLDQRMALGWIEQNIHKFGGDKRKITLLGHGTSGATNAMIHLTNAKTASMLTRMILMSGSVYSTYAFQAGNSSRGFDDIVDPSMAIVKKLACDSAQHKYTLDCLRQKSVADLLKAFEHIYQHGNYTRLLGPQIDSYLPKTMQYLPHDPRIAIQSGAIPNIPIIVGICSNEGAFMQDLWLELAREGYDPLKKYVSSTILPNILTHYGFKEDTTAQTMETIDWRFFDQMPQTPAYLLNSLQRLLSETKFESPFLETIEKLTIDDTPPLVNVSNSSDAERNTSTTTDKLHRPKSRELFVYSFHMSKSMDIRGSINYFGGASHTSDLLYLMGPSLIQQIGRRKLSPHEMKLCKRMRQLFTDFVKTGNPTPGRLFDAWKTYSVKQKFIYIIGDASSATGGGGGLVDGAASNFAADFDRNAVEIDNLIHRPNDGQTQVVSSAVNPYQIGPSGHEDSAIDSNRMSKSYMGIYEASDYYNSLKKINAFWKGLLPKMNRYHYDDSHLNRIDSHRSDLDKDQLYIAAMAAGNGSKFKHAFFSMLILVCLLLAVLCVCLYILKKNQQNIDTSYL